MTTQRAVRGSDLTLHVLGEHYEVVRLGPGAAIPADLFSSNPSSSLVSITRTADELSIIRPRGARRIDGEKLEEGWRALKVQGPLPFHLVGVLSHLSATLAAANAASSTVGTAAKDGAISMMADENVMAEMSMTPVGSVRPSAMSASENPTQSAAICVITRVLARCRADRSVAAVPVVLRPSRWHSATREALRASGMDTLPRSAS